MTVLKKPRTGRKEKNTMSKMDAIDNIQPEEIVLGWDTVHKDCDALAEKLAGRTWDGIIAVARGGLVPAALIARALDNKLIETLCVASYDHQDQKKLEILKTVDHIGSGKNWLVIDDLTDTGATFEAIRKMLPDAHCAALYVKPQGAPHVNTFIRDYHQHVWINFPWELQAGFSAGHYEEY